MTLQPQNTFSIPEETVRVARSAFPKGNLYMKMRDVLGTIYQDQAFAHLFASEWTTCRSPLAASVDDSHSVFGRTSR